VPYDEDGKFYTTRIEDDDAERLIERSLNAYKYGRAGQRLGSLAGPVGGVVGGTLGGIGGFILGDQETVFPVDMIAIPAYQAYLLNGQPSFVIYIKEGEVLTQVQPTDAMVTEAVLEEAPAPMPKKRAPSKWNKYCAKKSNQIKFKSGKKKGLLNLKAMGVQYRKSNKKRGRK
tara:strand:+ start:2020 stop:2538 length:519 start_codon:yes stop_codon:yes gene_type:complete